MAILINGINIEEQVINDEIERLRPQYEQIMREKSPEQREEELRQWSRENVIERELIRQAALAEDKPVEAQRVEQEYQYLIDQHGGREKFFERFQLTEDRVGEVKNDIEQRIKVESFLTEITAEVAEPTEQEILDFYNEYQEYFLSAETIHAAHIVKHHKPGPDKKKIIKEMERLLGKLRQGADFQTLARQHSDCPDNAGDLGTFGRGQMVQAFEDQAFNTDPGHYTDVFETEFGFHIVYVIERNTPELIPVDDVRDKIQQELINRARQKALEDFVDAAKEKADIKDA